MVGTAFLIYGEINSKKIKPIKDKIWKKFCKRIRREKTTVDFTFDPIKNYFLENFKDYLDRKLINPWEASKHILEYLEINEMDIFIRKDMRDRRDYIRINFFSSGGTTQVSAEVACHWFEMWYNESKDEIYEVMKEIGFNIEEEGSSSCAKNIFLPTENYGYVMMNEDQYHGKKIVDIWSRHFRVDNGIMEYYGGNQEFNEYGKNLDLKYDNIVENKNCRCQICAKKAMELNDILENAV